jgi:hypothetical protein
MEKDEVRTVRTVRTYSPPPRVVRQYEDDEDDGDCREVEVLAQVNGRPERVYSTACYENGAWILQDSRRVVSQTVIIDRDREYHPARGHYRHKEKNHWRESRYRPAYQGYSGRGRDCDNTRIIFR